MVPITAVLCKAIDFLGFEFNVFGNCNGDYYANSGMYMGYNNKLQQLLNYFHFLHQRFFVRYIPFIAFILIFYKTQFL